MDASVPPFVQCPRPNSCLPGGTCAPGTRGWMCIDCGPGYVSGSANNACVQCTAANDASPSFILLVVAAVVMLLVVLLVLRWFAMQIETRPPVNLRGARAIAEQQLWMLRHERVPLLAVSVRTVICFLQTLAILTRYIPNVLSTDPNSPLGAFMVSVVFQDLGATVTQLHCLVPIPRSIHIIIYLIAPALCFAIGPLAAWLATRRCHRRGHAYSPLGHFSFLVSTLFLMIVLTPVFITLTNSQVCAPLAQGFYLLVDPSTSCVDPEYVAVAYAATVAVYIYLCLLALLCVFLYIGVPTGLQSRFEFWWVGFAGTVQHGALLSASAVEQLRLEDAIRAHVERRLVERSRAAAAAARLEARKARLAAYRARLAARKAAAQAQKKRGVGGRAITYQHTGISQAPVLVPQAAVANASDPVIARPIVPAVRLKLSNHRTWGTAYSWEAVSVLRRAILACISTSFFQEGDVPGKLLVTILILAASLAMHTAYSPYADASSNVLVNIELGTEIFFALALLASLPDLGLEVREKSVVISLAIIAVVVFGLVWLLHGIDAIVHYGSFMRRLQVRGRGCAARCLGARCRGVMNRSYGTRCGRLRRLRLADCVHCARETIPERRVYP